MAPSRIFALALASIALISPLAVHLFFPVIPAIKIAFGISDALAQLTFSVAMLGMAVATLFYGALSDRYGRRPILLSGLVLFLIGSALSAIAGDVYLLVLGRLVQAVGAGCSITLVRAIARDAYGAEQLVKAIAYLTMFYTLGPMISPLAAGLLIDLFGWRSVFAFALLMGVVITLGAFSFIPETRPPGERTTAEGTGMLRSFLQLFSRPRFTAFVSQTGFSTGTFIVLATASATLMKEHLQRSSTEYGLWFVLFPLGFFCGNLITTRIGTRGRTEAMVLTGSLVGFAAVVVQSSFLLAGILTPAVIFLPAFFITMAQGIAMPYGQAGAMATIPRIAGTAAGIGVFVQQLCGGVFAQLYGLIANGTPGPMMAVMGLSAALCLLAGVTPMLLQRRDR
ncbi:MAG: multidrug effflux MFS transporter [Hyphomicrobiales bacterium]|nr:multidrug effflux MFS transporter [Hyphomicrobiales bacterium]